MATATLEMIDPKIRDFVTTKRKLLIDGKWVDAQSGETFPVYNPATGDVMDQCAAGDKADIDLAVKAARRAFERGPWSRLTHGQRGKLIWKLADLIEEHLEEFAQIESLDNGKPLAIARVADVPVRSSRWRAASCRYGDDVADIDHVAVGWRDRAQRRQLRGSVALDAAGDLDPAAWHIDQLEPTARTRPEPTAGAE